MRRLLTAIQWVLANISCSCGGTGVWDGSKYVCNRCGNEVTG